eukprot:gene13368-biopygen6510
MSRVEPDLSKNNGIFLVGNWCGWVQKKWAPGSTGGEGASFSTGPLLIIPRPPGPPIPPESPELARPGLARNTRTVWVTWAARAAASSARSTLQHAPRTR